MGQTTIWTTSLSAVFVAGVALAAMPGCNAILGNEEGTLDSGVSQPADSGDPSACAAGTKSCFGQCVNNLSPEFGCAAEGCDACDLPHAYASCAGGTCSIRQPDGCLSGYENCNQNNADGCETDLSVPTSCGGCTTQCQGFRRLCAPAGAGGGFSCTDQCRNGLEECSGQCVDTKTSAQHCGGCDKPCPAVANGEPACVDGKCQPMCKTGFHRCGETCERDVDPDHCGDQCVVCPRNPPSTGATCFGGQCGIQCASGFANCDNNPSNFCEVNLTQDPKNCGACGNQCEITGDDTPPNGIARCCGVLCVAGSTCPLSMTNR